MGSRSDTLGSLIAEFGHPWGPHCQAGVHEIDPVEMAFASSTLNGREPHGTSSLPHLLGIATLSESSTGFTVPLRSGTFGQAALGSSPGDSTSCFTSSSYGILSGSNEDFGNDFGLQSQQATRTATWRDRIPPSTSHDHTLIYLDYVWAHRDQIGMHRVGPGRVDREESLDLLLVLRGLGDRHRDGSGLGSMEGLALRAFRWRWRFRDQHG